MPAALFGLFHFEAVLGEVVDDGLDLGIGFVVGLGGGEEEDSEAKGSRRNNIYKLILWS